MANKAQPPLLPLVRGYVERDPATAAVLLQTLPEEQGVGVLKALPPGLCAEIVPRLDPARGAALLSGLSADAFGAIVTRLRPEQAADMLRHLPEADRARLLDHLPERSREEVREVLTYPEDSAGRIMKTEFLSFHRDVKVRAAVQRLRALVTGGSPPRTYTYVVDDENRLVGVLDMRDLLLASGEAKLGSIMKTDVFAVDAFMDREEVAHEVTRRRFFAVPVVDAERRLLGVVKADHLLGHVREEATEDLVRMVGAGADERPFSPVLFSMRKRLPWLHVNLATAFLAGAVVAVFEGIIAKITVLAVFLPVVAGQGGNAGAQSLALVMRGLVLRQVRREQVLRLVAKEGGLGALNGLIIGAVTAAAAWAWAGNPVLGAVVGLAMIINLVVAGLSGAAIPVTMKSLGLDPAQCSSIILTTVTDVVGFLAFLGLAVLFQRHLV